MKNLKKPIRVARLLSMFTLLLIFSVANAAETITENRDVKEFNAISISGAYKVILVQGDKEGVTITGEAEDVKETKTEVKSNTLRIYREPDHHKSNSIQVTVYFKMIGEIDCSGAVSLTTSQPLKVNALELNNSGSSTVEMNVNTTSLEIDISGSGALKISGNTQALDLDISGSGSLKAGDLKSDNCEVNISGAGVAEVDVTTALDISVSGSGVVRYKGEPKITQNISGSGKVVKL